MWNPPASSETPLWTSNLWFKYHQHTRDEVSSHFDLTSGETPLEIRSVYTVQLAAALLHSESRRVRSTVQSCAPESGEVSHCNPYGAISVLLSSALDTTSLHRRQNVWASNTWTTSQSRTHELGNPRQRNVTQHTSFVAVCSAITSSWMLIQNTVIFAGFNRRTFCLWFANVSTGSRSTCLRPYCFIPFCFNSSWRFTPHFN